MKVIAHVMKANNGITSGLVENAPEVIKLAVVWGDINHRIAGFEEFIVAEDIDRQRRMINPDNVLDTFDNWPDAFAATGLTPRTA